DYRFDACIAGCFVELDGTVHVPVVRHGHCRTVRRSLLHPLDQLLDASSAVQQAVGGVLMQMSEARSRSRHGSSVTRVPGLNWSAFTLMPGPYRSGSTLVPGPDSAGPTIVLDADCP